MERLDVRAHRLAEEVASSLYNIVREVLIEEFESRPSIIGRERTLMETVAKLVHAAVRLRYDYSELSETERGYLFEVRVTTSDGEPTGRVARITVELDRVEET